MFRNLLVNWMVLIPLIATAAMVPRLYLGLLGLPSQPELVSRATLDWWYVNDWIPIVILIAIGTTYAAMQLPSLGHRAAGTRSFAIWFLGPVLLVLFLLSVHRFWAWHFGDDVSLGIEARGLGSSHGRAVDCGRGLQQSLVAAVDMDRSRRGRPSRSPGDLVGASFHHQARATRPAGIRGRRSSHVAVAALPADHGLHRTREPGHVRRRPRVVGPRRTPGS